ncbi:response regulator [Halalkalibacter sp. AB-rgal2]|uniref:response regulator transcription factor n=1 Tax=Halalkalibacter sp. AB-rgal2 TaxID=3242695 RepID=UPI00359DD907
MTLIKVLIVDDDQLVRKGLMFVIPWKRFGMQVVGEANNGQKALDFLGGHKVDLIITDLNMPVMSGIELLRIVHETYPDIFIAVLTLHQDFEYIQEALRLGAIDFITKVEIELDSNKLDQVMGRICKRITDKKQVARQQVGHNSWFSIDRGFAIFLEERSEKKKWLDLNVNQEDIIVETVDPLFLFCTAFDHVNFQERNSSDSVILEVRGIKEKRYNEVFPLLLGYRDKLIFYHDSSQLIKKSIGDIEKENHDSIKEIAKIKKELFDFKWVYQLEEYETIVSNLEALQLHPDEIFKLLYEMLVKWEEGYPYIPLHSMERDFHFYQWKEVVNWLEHFKYMIKVVAGSRYSVEVVNSILQATKLIKEQLQQPLTADEVARMVNMSRSYFNKCFKEIIGKSFHHYLRELRIEKAKRMIEQTKDPVHIIAGEIGYLDEKYFSRIFREQTGFLPSEYRKKHRSGERWL